MSSKGDFGQILSACARFAGDYPGIVFIGGVAVYMQAVNSSMFEGTPGTSHDADFVMPLSELAQLSDQYRVVSNKRLRKHEVVVDGIEFDVYVEHNNKLAVPYDEIFAHAVDFDGMKIACLEHLLVLRLDALQDRKGSDKGDKDEWDLLTIAAVAGGEIRPDIVAPYLRDEHTELLSDMKKSPAFIDVAGGNLHTARKLRKIWDALAAKISRS